MIENENVNKKLYACQYLKETFITNSNNETNVNIYIYFFYKKKKKKKNIYNFNKKILILFNF